MEHQTLNIFSIKGINFESRLKPAKAKSISKTKKRVNQNEESKNGNSAILLSEVPKFIYKVGNESQIDDSRLLSANILLTDKDLQKIDVLVYVDKKNLKLKQNQIDKKN